MSYFLYISDTSLQHYQPSQAAEEEGGGAAAHSPLPATDLLQASLNVLLLPKEQASDISSTVTQLKNRRETGASFPYQHSMPGNHDEQKSGLPNTIPQLWLNRRGILSSSSCPGWERWKGCCFPRPTPITFWTWRGTTAGCRLTAGLSCKCLESAQVYSLIANWGWLPWRISGAPIVLVTSQALGVDSGDAHPLQQGHVQAALLDKGGGCL